MQKLIRVPATLDLQSLKYETLLGKVASTLEKFETLLDRYMPLSEDGEERAESDSSNVSEASCVRVNRSVVNIITRPVNFVTVKTTKVLRIPAQLKASYMDGSLKLGMKAKVTSTKKIIASKVTSTKKIIASKATPVLTQATKKLAPKVAVVTQSSLFKKVLYAAVISSEKTLGKEKTAAILSKAETCIPEAWKPESSVPKSIQAKKQ